MNEHTRPRQLSWMLAALLLTACGARAAGDDEGYQYEFCENGALLSATCTGGICDPAPFTRCDDGSCAVAPAGCPARPAGYDFEYCEEGVLKTAACAEGLCDPLPFDVCGDGSCVLRPARCPAATEPPRFTFCEDGTIKTAACEGGICDPAPFADCGDGSCVLVPATCPAGGSLTYEQLADPTRVVACGSDADCCLAFDFCPTNAYVIHTSQKAAVEALIAAQEPDGCCSCGYPAVAVSCEGGACVGRRVLGAFGHPKPDGSYDEACDGFFGGCFDPLPPSCPLGESSTSFITNYI